MGKGRNRDGVGKETRSRVASQPLADRTGHVSCARGRRQRGPAPRGAFQQGAREGRFAAEPGAESPRGSGVGEGGLRVRMIATLCPGSRGMCAACFYFGFGSLPGPPSPAAHSCLP